MIKIYGYKRCSTCIKAKKHFEQEGNVDFFDFVQEQIDVKTLENLITRSNHDIDDFFNKNGVVFKEMGLKEKLQTLSEKEKFDLLLSDGKLIKRPIIDTGKEIEIGFKIK